MCSVPHQPSETYLGVAELPLDHAKRGLYLRSHLRLGLLDLALGFVQGAAFIEHLVGAAACCDLPDHFSVGMLGALFDAGVAGIGTDDVLVAVQQFVDLGDIRHGGLYLTVCGD